MSQSVCVQKAVDSIMNLGKSVKCQGLGKERSSKLKAPVRASQDGIENSVV